LNSAKQKELIYVIDYASIAGLEGTDEHKKKINVYLRKKRKTAEKETKKCVN
jgi:hypothetical protein